MQIILLYRQSPRPDWLRNHGLNYSKGAPWGTTNFDAVFKLNNCVS